MGRIARFNRPETGGWPHSGDKQIRRDVCRRGIGRQQEAPSLYRTAADLESLLPLGPIIRLVKGAYQEPASIAFPRKRDVDKNYFLLARRMLSPEARRAGMQAAMATHDRTLIRLITEFAEGAVVPRSEVRFQMLYGIRRAEQLRLARDAWRSAVLIAYGSYWFPWFMRRLAERPANLWFVARNLIG